ncbi:hypothetical protein GCM10011613_35940 [Cellvibrio zantedeschiae]|uniref:Uncharacterized protein n=1 Tax=Cellvibrio zantedeschiae TaxID=1237077 RepID=A0ABQ3BAF1_9GAMM|nr:hypothetical protein GCM10011613_35940 [Cellvibrio zantedeschiae]
MPLEIYLDEFGNLLIKSECETKIVKFVKHVSEPELNTFLVKIEKNIANLKIQELENQLKAAKTNSEEICTHCEQIDIAINLSNSREEVRLEGNGEAVSSLKAEIQSLLKRNGYLGCPKK